jgi:hypothetical protein
MKLHQVELVIIPGTEAEMHSPMARRFLADMSLEDNFEIIYEEVFNEDRTRKLVATTKERGCC